MPALASTTSSRSTGCAVVALGSNLPSQFGSPAEMLLRAMEDLRQLSAGPLQASSLYRTAPIDCAEGTPDFINAVVMLVPAHDESPEGLLRQLKRIEQAFQRERAGPPNSPRTLDLDLICWGEHRSSTDELKLPHPLAHERLFVLRPLAEIAPDLCIPGQALSVSELAARLDGQRISRID